MRSQFKAISRSTDHSDLTYENGWFILMRNGEYGAQVEELMSHLYRFFMGYATEIEIVKDNDDFYVATHVIRNFIPWHEACPYLQLDNGQLVFNKDGAQKPVTGLGAMCALTEFFHESDTHGGNFGLQVLPGECRAFRIDNEHALTLFSDVAIDTMEMELRSDLNVYLRTDYTQSAAFLAEKTAMQRKIAECPFGIIEAFLRYYITSNQLESSRWTLTKMLANLSRMEPHPVLGDDGEVEDDGLSEEQIKVSLAQIDKENPRGYGAAAIIECLYEKHIALIAHLEPQRSEMGMHP